ncbi:MAG: hypothetical protein QXT86_08760 [Archaeoglobaceae archaeon]
MVFGEKELRKIIEQLRKKNEKDRKKYGLLLGDGIIPSPRLLTLIASKYDAISVKIMKLSFKGVLVLSLNTSTPIDDDLEI